MGILVRCMVSARSIWCVIVCPSKRSELTVGPYGKWQDIYMHDWTVKELQFLHFSVLEYHKLYIKSKFHTNSWANGAQLIVCLRKLMHFSLLFSPLLQQPGFILICRLLLTFQHPINSRWIKSHSVLFPVSLENISDYGNTVSTRLQSMLLCH